MKRRRNQRRFGVLLLGVVLLLALSAAFLHHHEAGDGQNDCSVCHFVKHLPFVVIPTLLLFFTRFAAGHHGNISPQFIPSFFSSNLGERAPPSPAVSILL